MDGRGVGGGVGWVGRRRRAKASTMRQKVALFSQQGTETATVNLVGPDGRWQQFDIPCSPIDASQWLHGPCS